MRRIYIVIRETRFFVYPACKPDRAVCVCVYQALPCARLCIGAGDTLAKRRPTLCVLERRAFKKCVLCCIQKEPSQLIMLGALPNTEEENWDQEVNEPQSEPARRW